LGCRLMSLEPWRDPAVRQWLEECGFGPTDQGGRKELYAVTGNWPWLLQEFHRLCKSPGAWGDHLRRLSTDLEGKTLRAEFLRAGGLEGEQNVAVLRQLAAYAPVSETDFLTAFPEGKAEEVRAVLCWAEWLQLAYLVEQGWVLDPVLARLLRPEER